MVSCSTPPGEVRTPAVAAAEVLVRDESFRTGPDLYTCLNAPFFKAALVATPAGFGVDLELGVGGDIVCGADPELGLGGVRGEKCAKAS
jgi:hypothetical protein